MFPHVTMTTFSFRLPLRTRNDPVAPTIPFGERKTFVPSQISQLFVGHSVTLVTLK